MIAMTSNAVLQDVVVVAAPVTIKGDTIEYNAGSFKVNKPNAVVEDLLKKLPGVEVESDGTIKANGQEVKRILVDGKQFFSNDPKLASKNLQADMVNKVQVFDKKSDKSEFTGFDDGNSEPTINLTLKNDKRTGVFGKAGAGYGTDNRYQANANINSFKKGEQLSFIGQANNVNQQGFSIMDALNFSGGAPMMGGGRGGTVIVSGGSGLNTNTGGNNTQGITTTQAAGVNYNNFKNSKLDFTSSYFFNGTQLDNDYETRRETSVGDSMQLYTEPGSSARDNYNHRFNMGIDWKIDSFNSLKITPSFTWQNTNTAAQKTYTTFGTKGEKLLQGVNDTYNKSQGYNASATALYRHRFARKGRTFSAQVNIGHNASDADGGQYTYNDYTNNGAGGRRDSVLNQQNTTAATALNSGISLSYTEPVSRRSLIEFSAYHNFNTNTTDRKTYDYDSTTAGYSKLNERLTNFFDNDYKYSGTGINYKENRTGWNYTIGATLQYAELSSLEQGKTEAITQQFLNVLPSANLQIGKNRYRNFRAFYNGATRNPSVAQLQPVENISDPLNITRGNPNLKQEFTNNLRLNWSSFDPYTMKSFFLFGNLRQSINAIVNSDSVGMNGARLTTYENADGVFSSNANVAIGLPIKMGGTRANLNLSTGLGYSQNINLLNGEENKIVNANISQRVSASYNYKELFDVSLGGSVLWNRAKYSLQPSQNTNYFTYTANVETNWYLPHNFIIGTNVDFTANTGRAEGYNNVFTLLNAYVAKQFLKNKRGELRLYAFDILNQNTGVSRYANGNYVEDTRYTVLQRYATLTFTYSLSKFGNLGGGGGPRMMMIGGPR
jgi:hypothetical protein